MKTSFIFKVFQITVAFATAVVGIVIGGVLRQDNPLAGNALVLGSFWCWLFYTKLGAKCSDT